MELDCGILLSQGKNNKGEPCIGGLRHTGQELRKTSVDQGGDLLRQHRFQSNAPAVRFVIPPRKFMRAVAGNRAAIF